MVQTPPQPDLAARRSSPPAAACEHLPRRRTTAGSGTRIRSRRERHPQREAVLLTAPRKALPLRGDRGDLRCRRNESSPFREAPDVAGARDFPCCNAFLVCKPWRTLPAPSLAAETARAKGETALRLRASRRLWSSREPGTWELRRTNCPARTSTKQPSTLALGHVSIRHPPPTAIVDNEKFTQRIETFRSRSMSSSTLPVPRTTEDSGSSASTTGRPVSLRNL